MYQNLKDDLKFHEEEALYVLTRYYTDEEIEHHLHAVMEHGLSTISEELQSRHPACLWAFSLLSRVRRVEGWLSSGGWQTADINTISTFALECICIGSALGGIMHDGLKPCEATWREFRMKGPEKSRTRVDERGHFMAQVVEMCRKELGRDPSPDEFYMKLEELAENDEPGYRHVVISYPDREISYLNSKGTEKTKSYKTVQNYLSDYKKRHPLPQN